MRNEFNAAWLLEKARRGWTRNSWSLKLLHKIAFVFFGCASIKSVSSRVNSRSAPRCAALTREGIVWARAFTGEDGCGPVSGAEWDVGSFQVGSSYYGYKLQPQHRTADRVFTITNRPQDSEIYFWFFFAVLHETVSHKCIFSNI